MQRKIKLALVQFCPESEKIKNNLQKAKRLSIQALEQGANIVVLPELFDSGYCVDEKKFAIDFSNQNYVFENLKELAKHYKAYIVACSIQKDKTLYDSAYIIGSDGLIGTYKKIYLWKGEEKRFSRGKDYPIFELDFDDFKVKLGLQICYEIGFGEGARILALKGAEIICYPSAFGKARSYVWDLASRARAIENGVFIIAANRCGNETFNGDLFEFGGRSKIINPKGEILKELLEEEEFLCVEVNVDDVKVQRDALPYLKDLNLNLQQKILKNIYLKKE